MGYLDEVSRNVENNKRAIYDLSQVLTDYIEMRGKSTKLNDFMQNKHLGSNAGIPTRWSVLSKFFKDSYLSLKKILAFGK